MKQVDSFVVLLMAIVPLTLLFFVFSGVAADNYWMIRAFDVDESGVLGDIQGMYEQGTWKPPNYIYGTAHTYITLLILKIVAFFRTVSFPDVAIAARFVNFAAFVGIGLQFVLWLRNKLATKWIFLLLVTFFFMGVNFKYAFNAKPEHLQTFFLVSSFILFGKFLENRKSLFLLMTGVLTGFTFATKYAGLLLFCFLTLYLCCVWLVREKGNFHLGLLCKWFFLLTGGTLAGVVLLGPYLIIDFPVVYEVLKAQSGVIGSGYFTLEDKTWFGWLTLLFSRDLLWWGLALWLLPGTVCFFLAGGKSADDWPGRLLPLAWVFFYLVYLTLMVAQKSPRFVIVTLPFLLYLVYASLDALEKSFPERMKKMLSAAVFLLALSAILFMGERSWQHGADLLQRQHSNKLLAGSWLAENALPSSVIASDLYTYVPPEFRRHFHQLYLTAYDVMKVRPDYLVVSRAIMSRYLDLNTAERYREGTDAFMRHYYLYSKLDADDFPGYRRLQDFGDVIVYGKE